MDAAGAVLDDDQDVEAPQQHGVHVDEVDRQDAAGLRGQELFPGRSGAPGRGADPGIVEDLPDSGGGDVMAEPVPPEYSIGRVDLPFLAAGLAR
jgi:hypothetical protein